MRRTFLILCLIALGAILFACEHDPEFYIDGVPFYTETTCIKSKHWTEYGYRYGYSFRGKYEFSVGPIYKSECLLVKIDTIKCEP